MIGVVLVSFCCLMFIHLGLGDTISRILHFDFVLFRCVKCLTFWTVLGYTLFIVELPFLGSLASAFAMSYVSLWADLGLAIMAYKYDNWYEEESEKHMDSEEDKDYE